MPPKVRYTKEEISEAAYELVRKYGKEFLTARNLAATLGSSTAPIFTAFSGIDELTESVIERAKALYGEYIAKGLSEPLPFKAAGLKYIQFAKDEPELFKLLFMSSATKKLCLEFVAEYDDNAPRVQSTLESYWQMCPQEARKIYNHLAIYCHGIAVMIADGSADYTDQEISDMLSEVFYALKGESKNEQK